MYEYIIALSHHLWGGHILENALNGKTVITKLRPYRQKQNHNVQACEQLGSPVIAEILCLNNENILVSSNYLPYNIKLLCLQTSA